MKFYIILLIVCILGVILSIYYGFMGLIYFALIYFFIIPEQRK